MAKIAPSILSADFANLERDIHDIEVHGGDWVHVDVIFLFPTSPSECRW